MGLSYKQRLAKWLGHDPVITEAASTVDYIKDHSRDLPSASVDYVKRLLPIHRWILNYNLRWGVGDLIAGFTVGMVVVPQSMSYAKIATLSPEFGLYSSFVGVMTYALFATSKDVTIGPVAVMSLQVSKVIKHVQAKPDGANIPANVIATALALICGIIVTGLGLLRLGWIVEFISAPAISGFMTGSAISIAAGQVPGLMGYSKKFDTRAETYKVIINSFKHLPDTTRDAAFGLIGLAFLYITRFILNRVERNAKSPGVRRAAFFANTFRTAFLVIFETVFAWVYLRHKNPKKFPISILGTVPSGFKHMGVPDFNSKLLRLLASEIPVSTILVFLEHIAISKSFGRVNNYKIDPNQELVAIGVNNIFSSFFGAYPSTGSFSRTAIKSRAGVRTPIAGWVTGVVVVVALYGLTPAFYWIPSAGLSAVIIEAVGGLIASPQQSYRYWLVSPLEFVIFLAAVFITIFSSIENGIYFSIAASAALLLVRIAKPRGKILGRVRVRNDDSAGSTSTRDVYLPLHPDGVRNPNVVVEPPPAGVIVFRMEESFLYINSANYTDQVVDYAHQYTRNGQDYSLVPQGDRPWADPGPNRFQLKGSRAKLEQAKSEANAAKPLLKAVVFDFAGVSAVDTTSVQALVDLHKVLSRYAGQPVTFHFATILSPWIKRALLAGGFGRDVDATGPQIEVGDVVQQQDNADQFSQIQRPPLSRDVSGHDIKEVDVEQGGSPPRSPSLDEKVPYAESAAGTIVDSSLAYFHLDLPSAVAAAAATKA
ncbi:Sulfate permease 2 [Rhodotorula toruloides]